MNTIKLILVDDHPVVRDGIFASLIKEKEIEIVGEASNGDELFSLLENNTKADVILLDISMPKQSGIDITAIVREKYPDIKILIFSSHTDEDSIFNSIRAGANGYLPKDAMRTELVIAIKEVYIGNEFLSESIPNTIIMKYINKAKNQTFSESKTDVLTKREMEILKNIAEGLHYKEIGKKLFISARTVETHKNNIMQKLHLNTTIELVKYAIKHKIIKI